MSLTLTDSSESCLTDIISYSIPCSLIELNIYLLAFSPILIMFASCDTHQKVRTLLSASARYYIFLFLVNK